MKFSTLRRIVPAIAIVALALFTASCSSTKKYGCPNHLNSGSFSVR